MKKKFVSALLILSILMTYAAPVFAENSGITFTDVPQSHWAHDVIYELAEKGVISGMGDGTFAPEGQVTREQFMKLLVCALGCNIDGKMTVSLSDVGPENWSAPYIYAGINRGIFSVNDSGNTFYPYAELKRGITAQWIVDGLGIDTEAANTFSDVPSGGKQSEDIAIAAKTGIILGYEDHTFRADNTLTRAEAAVLIKRVMDYQAKRSALREDAANEIELQDGVKVAQSSETVNTPVSADENGKSVTFSNADETLKALSAGDVLFVLPCRALPSGLLGKVVSASGSENITIEFEEPELTEVVKSADISAYLYVDAGSFSDNGDLMAVSAAQSPRGSENGLDFSGDADADAVITITKDGVEIAAYATANEKASVHFETDSYKDKKGIYAALDMSMEVKVDIQLETDNFDINKFEASVDLLTNIDAVGGYSNALSKEYSYKFPSCNIPIAGVFSITLDSYLVVSADGSLNIEATAVFDNDMGAKFSLDDGFTTHNNTSANAGLTVDAEGSLKIGPREELQLTLCGIKIFNKTFFEGVSLLQAGAAFGVGANGKTSVDKSVGITDGGISFGGAGKNHLCDFCIQGDIVKYFNGSVAVGEDIQDLISLVYDKELSYTFADIEDKISDWHLSSGEGYWLEFELRECPHYGTDYYQFIHDTLLPQRGYADVAKKEKTISYNDYWQNFQSYNYWDDRSGLVSADIADLDGNNVDDLIVYYYDKEGTEVNLYAQVYSKNANDEIYLIGTQKLGGSTACEKLNFNAGLIPLSDGIYLYVESHANGMMVDYSSNNYSLYRLTAGGKWYKRYEIGQSDGGTSEIAYSIWTYTDTGSAEQSLLWADNGYYAFNPNAAALTPKGTSFEDGIRTGLQTIGMPGVTISDVGQAYQDYIDQGFGRSVCYEISAKAQGGNCTFTTALTDYTQLKEIMKKYDEAGK